MGENNKINYSKIRNIILFAKVRMWEKVSIN